MTDLDDSIIHTVWFGEDAIFNLTIGVVAIKKTTGWKAYMGLGDGCDESVDIQRIKKNGAGLIEEWARPFFPMLNDEPYAS